jgi:hypothetical protein
MTKRRAIAGQSAFGHQKVTPFSISRLNAHWPAYDCFYYVPGDNCYSLKGSMPLKKSPINEETWGKS